MAEERDNRTAAKGKAPKAGGSQGKGDGGKAGAGAGAREVPPPPQAKRKKEAVAAAQRKRGRRAALHRPHKPPPMALVFPDATERHSLSDHVW